MIDLSKALLDYDDSLEDGACAIFDKNDKLIAIKDKEDLEYKNYWICDLIDDKNVALNNKEKDKYAYFNNIIEQCNDYIEKYR